LYADREGKPYVFPAVKQAFLDADTENFNYQPIGGNRDYLQAAAKFILGAKLELAETALQATCGGTQACRMFGDLLSLDTISRELYIGTPTWGNHFALFDKLKINDFPHLNSQGGANIEAYKKTVETAPEGSILVVHGGLTHNPSGRNLNLEQLQELLPIVRKRQLILFIDAAYAGMGEGLEQDLAWLRTAWSALEDVAIGFSFSKNASLYEHRTGLLMLKTERKEVVESQLARLARQSISMAPGLGQELMLRILTSQERRSAWLSELETARQDIVERKSKLLNLLPEKFAAVAETAGMFALLPLTEDQVLRLKAEFSIYIPNNRRINFGGLQIDDIDYIAEAIKSV